MVSGDKSVHQESYLGEIVSDCIIKIGRNLARRSRRTSVPNYRQNLDAPSSEREISNTSNEKQ